MTSHEFNRSSDGFRLNTGADLRAATVPLDTVFLYQALQQDGVLPNEISVVAIGNNHGEASVIPGSGLCALEEITGKLETLTLLGGETAVIEDATETLDFYLHTGREEYLGKRMKERVRLYFSGGELQSVRWIFADVTDRPDIVWRHGTLSVPARSERLLVVMKDRTDGGIRGRVEDRDIINHVFDPRWQITSVVYKQKAGIHFGEHMQWDQRIAKYTDIAGNTRTTSDMEAFLGVGHYISVGVTCSKQYAFSHPVNSDFGFITASMLAKGIILPERCFHEYIGGDAPAHPSVEVECRGEEHYENGAHLVAQIANILNASEFGSLARKGTLPNEVQGAEDYLS